MAPGPVSRSTLRVSIRKVLSCGAVKAPLLGKNLVDIVEMRLRRKMGQKANIGSALEKWLIQVLFFYSNTINIDGHIET